MTRLNASEDDRIERLRIVTRGYEMSPQGRVAPAQLLRYVEHVRWRTIAHSDRIPAREFMRLGVVRAQKLEFLLDTTFDVELEISMWLSRVGKTSLDFSHEVTRVEDGALVARSSATVVTLDSDRRPAPVDHRAREYVVTRDATPIERLEEPPPESAWEQPILIRPSDEDMQGHVNHARYADFVEDTRRLCAEARGYGAGSFDGAPRFFTISYDEETRVGDALKARTWASTTTPFAVDIVLVKGEGRIATRARVGFSVATVSRPERGSAR